MNAQLIGPDPTVLTASGLGPAVYKTVALKTDRNYPGRFIWQLVGVLDT